MTHMDLNKDSKTDNYRLNIFFNKKSKSHYTNVLDKDTNKLAQILIDLYFEGFPIAKAIEIFKERFKNKDWLGF